MKLTFLGAAERVTGSATLIEHRRGRLLADCGIFQGEEDAREANLEPFPFEAASLDAVVLTHAHLDHVGRLPRLVAAGYSGPVFTHPASMEIAEIVLRDAVHLMSDDRQPLYDEKAVEATLKLMRPLRYGEKMSVAGFELQLHDAGHILGSAHLRLAAGGQRVVMSGDIGQSGSPLIRDPKRDWAEPADLVVVESTYGDREHKDSSGTLEEFSEVLRRAADEKGMVLIPAFAIGRTQELLFRLRELIEAGRIPDMPVILDSPMAERVTGIYRKHRECYDEETWQLLNEGERPMHPAGLREVSSADESRRLKAMAPPAVIIAGSGMCTGGRILHHFSNLIEDPRTTVLFVGYQGRGTPGRRLVEGVEKITIYGQEYQVRAHIETLGGFSAHAGQTQLRHWCQSFPAPAPHFVVNHGEPQAAETLKELLERDGLAAQVARPRLAVEV